MRLFVAISTGLSFPLRLFFPVLSPRSQNNLLGYNSGDWESEIDPERAVLYPPRVWLPEEDDVMSHIETQANYSKQDKVHPTCHQHPKCQDGSASRNEMTEDKHSRQQRSSPRRSAEWHEPSLRPTLMDIHLLQRWALGDHRPRLSLCSPGEKGGCWC